MFFTVRFVHWEIPAGFRNLFVLMKSDQGCTLCLRLVIHSLIAGLFTLEIILKASKKLNSLQVDKNPDESHILTKLLAQNSFLNYVN